MARFSFENELMVEFRKEHGINETPESKPPETPPPYAPRPDPADPLKKKFFWRCRVYSSVKTGRVSTVASS